MFLSAHSALYCPPLKSIGTDVSVVTAQKTRLSHTLAALTVMKHKVMVGKINNLAGIFFPPAIFPSMSLSNTLPPLPSVCRSVIQCMVQQCHLWCAKRHFTLPYLAFWLCGLCVFMFMSKRCKSDEKAELHLIMTS